MRNYVKETWNKIPKGVKIVAGVAAVAAVAYVCNEGYKRYTKNDEPVLDNGGVVLEDVTVVVSDEAEEVIVSE